MPVATFPWLASAFYLLASAVLIQRLRQSASDAARPLVAGILAFLAILAHAAYHLHWLLALGGLDIHFFSALSWVSLSMAAFCVAAGLFKPLEPLGLFVFPMAAALLLLDHHLGHPRASTAAHSWQIHSHVVLALLAYATLCIASWVAIMLAVQERLLRTHRIGRFAHWFPPLVALERFLFQLISIGFILLTLTLVTGLLFIQDLFAQHLVHKTFLSLASWLVFGTLLLGRWRWGWRGLRAVHLSLWGMGLLLLAFLGSKFVLEIVLGYAA